MTNVQTVLLFVGGYLLSRLLLLGAGHTRFVFWLAQKSGGRVSRMVLGIMLGAFIISMFMPNALTVLALIPVVKAILDQHEDAPEGFRTVLTMAVVYGGNLGGVASLLGSPANLYLLLNLKLFDVPGRGRLNVVSWFAFGIPMTLTLILVLWLLIVLIAHRTMGTRLRCERALKPPRLESFHWFARLGVGFLGAWIALAALNQTTAWANHPCFAITLFGGKLPITAIDLAATGLTVVLIVMLFAVPLTLGPERRSLMVLKDLWREFPVKGAIFVAVVLVLTLAVALSGLVGVFERGLPRLLPENASALTIIFCFTTLGIFATELLSNTTVAAVLFPLAAAVARQQGMDPLYLMLAVSLASTSAFMTPVATPANALAFGGIGRVSLKTFALIGFFANLVCGLWITLFARYVIPLLV